MIKVENLTFSYPSGYDNIFENVSFTIDTDWKLGFVGRNGRGKTTFLNLLLSKYEYKGKITSSVKFDYFPFPVNDKTKNTLDILENISPTSEEWEFIRELSYLDLDAEVLYRPFETLSNGEQTKCLLSALFLNEGHFLLIDEPTNHLDSAAREIVSEYLRRKKGFILVSHDRRFIDDCVDHILSINRTNIEVQSGNFSSWKENFDRREIFEETQNEKLKREISHLKEAAERTSLWAQNVEASKVGAYDKGFVGHKAAKMMKRSKNIEARQIEAIEEKSKLLKNTEAAENLKIFPQRYHSDLLVKFTDVIPIYDGREIIDGISFEIHRGTRLVLDGKNGSGKSTLIKLILGHDIEYKGKISIGSGLRISYVSQDTRGLSGNLFDFAKSSGIDEPLFLAILRKMDFERVQFEKNIEDFSEGQKKKVLIARSLCEKAHLYVWDEPLNFIDIYSRMQIENIIKEFSPTMLLVEHDRAFRESVATDVIKL